MKIKVLGANSAFSKGRKAKVLPEENIAEYIRLISSNDNNTDHLFKEMYDPKFQTNFLITFDHVSPRGKKQFNLLYDAGCDIRHSLVMNDVSLNDIDAVYISHNHSDHVGGMEGVALQTFFNPYWSDKKRDFLRTPMSDDDLETLSVKDFMEKQSNQPVKSVVEFINNSNFHNRIFPDYMKPQLYAHELVLTDMWKTLEAGLTTLQGVTGANLDTYFHVKRMLTNEVFEFADGPDRKWKFYTVQSTHVIGGTGQMPCFGLFFESSDGINVYLPSDTMWMMPPAMESFYKKATYILQDTETDVRSGVHSFIDDIKKAPVDIKKKAYLCHYSSDPVIDDGEFAGILRSGDVLEF